ncbi:MAG: hybrid sensor histidine kinase/response regulator, partial [Deltaproteobacteria bacterium]
MSGLDLSQFLASFFDEARGRLASINEGLVAFESGSLDEEGLIRLRRDAHTIKGSAMMLGVEDVGGAAHVFEDAMEHLLAHPEHRVPAMIQFLFDLHDRLAERLRAEDAAPLDAAGLRARFGELLTELAQGSVAPAP